MQVQLNTRVGKCYGHNRYSHIRKYTCENYNLFLGKINLKKYL